MYKHINSFRFFINFNLTENLQRYNISTFITMYFLLWLGFKKYVILKRDGFVCKLYLNIPYPVVQLYQNNSPMLY